MSEPIVDLLEEVWRDIEDCCEGLSDEQWNLATECPGWSIQDQVAHMIGTERMLAGEQPSASADAADAPYVKNDIGRANEQWIASYRDIPGKQVLEEFHNVTQQRLRALRALSKEDWDREGFTPEGKGPYRDFMAIRVFDCWYHDQDIREALDLPGLLEGRVADFSLERIPRKGLGYVVAKKAGAPAGTSVVFEVFGTAPIVATIVVPPEGRAGLVDEVPDDPTVRIATDRRTFSRLAGGRWTGAHARNHGAVTVTGDKDLGNRIVDNMAFTI